MLSRIRKQVHYAGQPNWIAKLDTIVHELYHIDPERPGIRRMERADGTYSANCHGHRFFETSWRWSTVPGDAGPIQRPTTSCSYNFDELTARFGGVVGTTFRRFRRTRSATPRCSTRSPRRRPTSTCRVEPLKVRPRDGRDSRRTTS